MPFTLAHPAIIYPLRKTKLFLSALIIGSMSPDFLYFIFLHPIGKFGHTLLGLFTFCIPLGFMVFVIFHQVMKLPILALLPRFLQSKLFALSKSFPIWSIQNITTIVISILIGAITHIVWDAFTHETGYFVNIFFLDNEIYHIPLYKIFQHGSSLVGLSFICI